MPSHQLAYVDETGRRKPRKFAFTTKRIAELVQPASGRVWFYDAKTPGLCLMLTATGARSWYYLKKIAGRMQRHRIGAADEIGLDDARKLAADLNVQVAAGENPASAKRQRREGLTFGDAWRHFLETHSKPKKKTWREDERKHDVYLAAWDNRKLDDITGADVAALHARIGNGITFEGAKYGGKGAANRTMALLSAIINAAKSQLGFTGENPAGHVKRFAEQERERFLQRDELPRFFEAVQAEPATLRDFFLMALWTGARRANVQSMKWENVNIDAATWFIPVTKTGASLTLPLSPPALAILKARKADQEAAAKADPQAEPSPYVFPAMRRKGKHEHLSEPKTAWVRICKRAKLGDLRIHDLRRTLGSWQAAGGASLHVIGKSLGHRKAQTTAIYARLNLDPVRESVNAAAAAMQIAGQPAK